MQVREMDNKVILFSNKEDCCGCSACVCVCPTSAISMIVDDEGFEYPNIDETKCIRCFACDKVCPIKNAVKSNNKNL